MVSSERAGDGEEPLGVRDALTRIDQRIDDLRSDFNGRIDDLRSDFNSRIDGLRSEFDAKLKLLMWGIGIGFASVLATLGALLARGG